MPHSEMETPLTKPTKRRKKIEAEALGGLFSSFSSRFFGLGSLRAHALPQLVAGAPSVLPEKDERLRGASSL